MKLDVKRIYLDLDRTLIDTTAIMRALTQASAALYGFDINDLRQEYEQVSKDYMAGTFRAYSFFDQAVARGVPAERARSDMQKALSGMHFLFPDVTRLLRFLAEQPYDVRVVTFGKTDYQTFKFSLAPELAHLPITVVPQEKNAYLSQQQSVPSLLVDDRIITPLPNWCTQALIDRKAPQQMTKESDKLWRINTLEAVETLLRVGYNEPNQKGNIR